jgi:flagellar basal body P-ring formation protein FlgA
MAALLLSALLAAAPAGAIGFQDTVALDRAVIAFTGKAIGDEGGARAPVDARLKLKQCATLSMAWHAETHDSVVVTCTGPEWRIFVPLRMAATPAALKAVPVAVAPKLAPVIRRGDPVTIAAGSPGFSITREGIAMGDAAPGARFLVKVEDTRNPVQAVAIEAGRATLPGWAE